jgi:SepF-like predicted cell division protein (DUF552 family)
MKMKMMKEMPEMEKEMPEMDSEEGPEMESAEEESGDIKDMDPQDALECLEMADAIRADSTLMAEIRKLKKEPMKITSIQGLKDKANEMEE